MSSTLAISQNPESSSVFSRYEAPAVPNNLASASVPDTERTLEIKVIWGSSVLDSITTTSVPEVTLGADKTTSLVNLDVPSRGLRAENRMFSPKDKATRAQPTS